MKENRLRIRANIRKAEFEDRHGDDDDGDDVCDP